MHATEHAAPSFNAVTDNSAIAVLAAGRQRFNCAFKRIEFMGQAVHGHLEGLVVIVTAGLTFWHGWLLSTLKTVTQVTHSVMRRLNAHILLPDDTTNLFR